MKIYIVILFLVIFYSCEHIVYKFKFVNTSDKTISVFLDKNQNGKNFKNYFAKPYFTDSNNQRKLKYFHFISPKDTSSFPILGYWDSKSNFNNYENCG